VIDRAIQIHGAGGLSDYHFLAQAWVYARTIRIADGPDAVHIKTIGSLELSKKLLHGPYKASEAQLQFDEAIKTFAVIRPYAETQFVLDIYGYYHQATVGDIPDTHATPRDPRESAKVEAWKALKGMTKEEAMKKYVQLVNHLKQKRAKL
jgi:diazepam-binding inhibitor (GABA receptor modulating acyl-CoA-binding protein)